ncbi:TPA: hypothetical protein PXM19_002454 [Yersinia enterocolitica]|uniref:hypothetical protein n=1 Tax=Yersinia enterocolitica TaxID=630 RepID=UPI0005E53304|nr:hypothetical protein [Yersinia enterocolitica]CNF83117.1 Uncharacterised protein [Yersinia enterocolitica]HDL6967027.1 hypothetical protein [Yersinia enterocolitica]HDL6975114.1 hypothetical protein [Yersinia enterocolitica]HDL6996414.1 hypothetical protein [Yersinia enterocolitica]HDL7095401.1 hypothetical protein [Yersinia enterocolitica]
MKLNLFCIALCLSILSSSVSIASTPKTKNHQSKIVTEFNQFVANDGKDEKGQPGIMSIDLKCSGVEETIIINGNNSDPQPVLVVSKPETFSLTPSAHGGMWPDSLEFDDMNVKNIIGWEYHYNAPNGTVFISMKNSGRVETIVNASKGKNKGESKSQCTVTE